MNARDVSELLKAARVSAGLTQAELAHRLSTTQSAIARLETGRSNPRLSTVARAMAACGRELVVAARPHHASIDETLVAERIRLAPGARIESFERSYANLRQLALSAAKARGRMA